MTDDLKIRLETLAPQWGRLLESSAGWSISTNQVTLPTFITEVDIKAVERTISANQIVLPALLYPQERVEQSIAPIIPNLTNNPTAQVMATLLIQIYQVAEVALLVRLFREMFVPRRPVSVRPVSVTLGGKQVEEIKKRVEVQVGETITPWEVTLDPQVEDGEFWLGLKAPNPAFANRRAWLLVKTEQGEYPIATSAVEDDKLLFKLDLEKLHIPVKEGVLKEGCEVSEVFRVRLEG